MPFQIKPPLTSAPKKQKHISVKDWNKHKPLMLAMRMQGKTAEQIRSELARKGFIGGIGPIKRLLSEWAPKNSSHRRRRLVGPSIPRSPSRRQTPDKSAGTNADYTFSPQLVKNDTANDSGTERMTKLELPGKGQPIDLDEALLKTPTYQNPRASHAHKAREVRPTKVAADILSTLEIDTSDRSPITECLSFEKWVAQEGAANEVEEMISYRDRHGFPELMRMAEELGEPDQHGINQAFPASGNLTHPERYQIASEYRPKGNKVKRFLKKSTICYHKGLFPISFISAYDAFQILRTWKPVDKQKSGMALYRMAIALFGSEQRYQEIIQILKMSCDYFRQSGDIDWELRAMVSLARAQAYLPASEEEIRNGFELILERTGQLSIEPTSAIVYADALWDARNSALEGLASLLQPEQTNQIMLAKHFSIIKRRGLKHRSTAWSLSQLAVSLDRLGLHSEAIQSSSEACNLFEDLYGSRDICEAELDLHYFFIKSERFQDAFQLYRKISPTKSKPWPPDRIVNVGRMLSGLGYHREALQLLQRGITGLKRSHHEGFYAITESKGWIADALYRRGLVLYADPVALDYMDWCEKIFGKHDPRTLDAILFCGRQAFSAARVEELPD